MMVIMNDQTMTTDSPITQLDIKEIRAKAKFRLICASKCKKFAIEIAQSNPVPQRAKMFTRVSEDFLIACEAQLKNFIFNRVRSHPSVGKTLT